MTLCKPGYWAVAEPLGSVAYAGTAGSVAASVQLHGLVRNGTLAAGGDGIRTSGIFGGLSVARFSSAKGRRSGKAAVQQTRDGKAGRGGKAEEKSEEDIVTRKQQLLEQAVQELRAKFGREAVMVLGGTEADLAAHRVPVIPSGSIALDAALGIGGFPRVRSKLMMGGPGMGMPVEVTSGGTQLPSPLSTTSLPPLLPTSFYICVQVRSKLMMGGPGMGMPVEVTSGGNALKFYASLRLHIKRVAQLKQGEKIVGNRVRVTVNKNKLAPPFRTAEFDIEFGHGISREGELLDLGVKEGLLTLSGAWYKKDGEVIGQGKEGARNFLKENVEVARELEEGIRERLGGRKREGDGEGKKGGVEGGKGVGSEEEGRGEEERGEEGEGDEREGEEGSVVTGVSG
ncbi:unnamed protein product [Closterium sp. Naga37s-1]|nr:unnamed protein product [Closterium sp. Naga37s-1]